MKILMLLSTSSVTGPAELCLDDARSLREAGHEVLFGLDTRRPGNYAEAIRAAGFGLMDELTLCPKPSAGEVVRDVLRLRRRMKDADLVHCRFAHDHAVALLAMQGLGRKPALVRTAEIAKSLRPGRVRGISFRACDAIIVSNADYAARLAREHEVEAGRVFVVPGRVDSTRFTPGDGSKLRAELKVAADEVLFGIVSRIKVERRHDLLVNAFAQVASRQLRAKLVIVGRGEYEQDVRELVRRLEIDSRVLFAGYRKDDALIDAYRALDAKVWLAEGNDGTCRAVLEAMACGKPAVVANESAMAEIVRDHEDGFVVEPNEAAIGNALEWLCDDRRRAEMSAAARQRAVQFDLANRWRALSAAYSAALERTGRGGLVAEGRGTKAAER